MQKSVLTTVATRTPEYIYIAVSGSAVERQHTTYGVFASEDLARRAVIKAHNADIARGESQFPDYYGIQVWKANTFRYERFIVLYDYTIDPDDPICETDEAAA